MNKPILDACCGSRMFWFDKDNPNVLYQDIRNEVCELSDGQTCIIAPDVVGDYTKMDYPDKSFKLVVFDPPHLVWDKKNANLVKRYGLMTDWRQNLHHGINECMRVLDDYGVLIFKWNEVHIKVSSILKEIDYTPLFGHRTSKKTIWMCFMKLPENKEERQ